jgi:hypothetical protein
VDPTVGLDDVKKRKFLTISGLELRPLGRPARNQSLYRLRYPSSLVKEGENNNKNIRTHLDNVKNQFLLHREYVSPLQRAVG